MGMLLQGRFSLTFQVFHFDERFFGVLESFWSAAFAAQEDRLTLDHDFYGRTHGAEAITGLDRAEPLGFG
jgi:hypothetical protein